jgi:hypothetical protein
MDCKKTSILGVVIALQLRQTFSYSIYGSTPGGVTVGAFAYIYKIGKGGGNDGGVLPL